ncbi:hypothetical protein MC885_003382 [Smutsia gigantea]|nr:hypothetical protein MC885_003382 [Smutsia gigantea]
MAETEDFVAQGPHPVDDDLFKEPARKRRRSDREQRFRAFPSVERSALKECESHETALNRLLALIEKPPLDPIYIGLFGSTGAGKSSLINAIIQQAMFLPVSGESICTSCIVQISSGCCEQYEAKIHLLSDQEWKEELKNLTELLRGNEELDREEADAWDRGNAAEEAIWKLQMLYGHGAERKSYEELLSIKPKGKVPTSRTITLKAEEAEELSVKLDPYIRTQRRDGDGESAEAHIWPLIKHVEVTLPKSELIPEGVVLVDIPGTGDFNSKRDEMWKKQAIQSQREAVLERNEMIKIQRNRILKEKLKRKLPADCKVLKASDLVYTVSAQDYWQQALLTEEETEIPKLRGYIRKRLLDKTRRMVTTYVTEASGLLFLTDSFNRAESMPNEYLHMSSLRRFVEEKIQLLEKAIEQCFAHITQPLQEGVRNARTSYRRILGACLVRSRGNQGFHQTLKAVCLKNGIYASRTLPRIDLNEAITQPIYDQIDPVFGGIFRAGKPTDSALMTHIDAFKHSLQEKLAEIGIRNGWKYDSCKKSFLIQEISAILGGLEEHILRKKRRLYESLTTSVQNDLKLCYEEAAQITGRKACERMKAVIRRGVDQQVAEGMFERAQERMQHQFQQLKVLHSYNLNASSREDPGGQREQVQKTKKKCSRLDPSRADAFCKNGVAEKVRGSIATMLTLASSQGDSLYRELADVKSEYREMEKLHRSLREVTENAMLRRGMQDFLLRTSPSKVGPAKT